MRIPRKQKRPLIPGYIAGEALAEQKALSSKTHFEVMDGLRGIAALAVVTFHTFLNGGPLPNGQLAVDLFFLLSGFVIAYSYDERLCLSMPIRDFMVRRLIRLYPMVFVGALGGILIALIHNKTNHVDAYPVRSIAYSGGLSLFVLPYLGNAINERAFSFNPPLWSLFFELVANVVYAVFARRLSIFVLVAIVISGLTGIVLGGPLGGGAKETILLGFPRVACGFFGGVLLFRLWKSGWLPKINGNFLILSAALVAIFGIPTLIGGSAFLPVYAIFLAIMICAIGARRSRFDKYCALLGQLSYPIYLIHWLTLYVFAWLGGKIGLAGPNYPILAAIHFCCVPFMAYFVARFYETPVRLFLTTRFKTWKSRDHIVPA